MSNVASEFMQPILQDQAYRQAEQLQPVETAQKVASTRYTSALADRVEQEAAADKSVAAQMAQMAGAGPQQGGTGSVSERLNAMSEMYAKAGLPTKAAALAQQASQAAAHEATASAAAVRSAAQKVKLQGDQFKMASNLLANVSDAQGWANANALFEQQTGQESPFKAIPYDPKVVKMLQDASLSAYQKSQLALRREAVKATVANVKSSVEHRATQDAIALRKLHDAQQREDRLAKNGGKDIGSPGKPEVAAASKLLGDTGLEGDELDAAAFSIASEAKVLRRKNPGISADEALRQAALTARTNGSITPGQHHILSRNDPAKFSAPVSLPSSGKKADLVDGQLYKSLDGKTAIWDKKAGTWKAVTATSLTKSAGGGGSDGEDPDGEDDE